MIKAKDIFRQINVLTQKLIEVGLCDYQNYPSIINKPGKIEEVSINNPPNSIFLKIFHMQKCISIFQTINIIILKCLMVH